MLVRNYLCSESDCLILLIIRRVKAPSSYGGCIKKTLEVEMHFLNWYSLLKKALNYLLNAEEKKEDMSHGLNLCKCAYHYK